MILPDDLFADDDKEKDEGVEKRNYLDENWDVNPEDRDSLRSFGRSTKSSEKSSKGALVKERRSRDPKADAILDKLEKKGLDLDREIDLPFDLDSKDPVPEYPVFVLNYVFKDEYADTNIGVSLTEHETYAGGFKRIISTDIMNYMPDGANKLNRGVSIVFAGLSDEPNEKEDTFQDILGFIADDPLILQDIVERWDVIDMDPEEDDEDAENNPEKERLLDMFFKNIMGLKQLTDNEQRELDEARISHPDWFFDGTEEEAEDDEEYDDSESTEEVRTYAKDSTEN